MSAFFTNCTTATVGVALITFLSAASNIVRGKTQKKKKKKSFRIHGKALKFLISLSEWQCFQ